MSDDRPPAFDRVPTLTEVVLEPAPQAPGLATGPATAPAAAAGTEALVQEVLAGLQPRIDLMFEYRVREALTPVLDELTREIVARTRIELGESLREVVARAVSHELALRQRRGGAATEPESAR